MCKQLCWTVPKKIGKMIDKYKEITDTKTQSDNGMRCES